MFAQAINTVSEFWQLYKGVERKWNKTNYQAEKVKKLQSSQDIPNFVKGYFFWDTWEKLGLKIEMVKCFVSTEEKFSQRAETVAI